jgi:tetratricopeptide (TPR) repeat protein
MRYGFTGTPQLDVLARLAELTESEHLDDLQRFAAFQWLTARSSAGTDVAESNRWADRAEELAGRTGDKRIVIGMGSTVGMARLLSGRYEDARRVAETALDAMGGRGNPSPDSPGAGETWAMSLSLLAHAHEAMGNTAEARRCLDEAVQEARRKEPFDPHTLGYVLNFRAVLHLMEDELALCVENAREMVELATRYEFAQIGASGEQFLACDEMARGDPEAGVDRWERALSQAMPFGHLRLRHVEGIARAGRPGDALRTALSHREVLRAAGEVFCSEELDAFIAQASFECEGDLRASAARFEHVLSEAAAHGAQGPRLRIAHRFARLLGGIGEVEHAIAVLDEALSGFPVPEGSRCHERASALREDLRRRAER